MSSNSNLFALSDQAEDQQGAVMAVSDSVEFLLGILKNKTGCKPKLSQEFNKGTDDWWAVYDCKYSEYYITPVTCYITKESDCN